MYIYIYTMHQQQYLISDKQPEFSDPMMWDPFEAVLQGKISGACDGSHLHYSCLCRHSRASILQCCLSDIFQDSDTSINLQVQHRAENAMNAMNAMHVVAEGGLQHNVCSYTTTCINYKSFPNTNAQCNTYVKHPQNTPNVNV